LTADLQTAPPATTPAEGVVWLPDTIGERKPTRFRTDEQVQVGSPDHAGLPQRREIPPFGLASGKGLGSAPRPPEMRQPDAA
jgi:hypothetical protein